MEDEDIKNRRFRKLIKDYDYNKVYDEKSGKEKTIVTYTGTYYSRNISEQELKKTKRTYAAFVFAGVVVFILAVIPSLAANRVSISVLLQVLCLEGMIASVACLIKFLGAPVMIKSDDYKYASKGLKIATLMTAIFCAMFAVFVIVYSVYLGERILMSVGESVLLLACAAGFFRVFYKENGCTYTKLYSNEVDPELRRIN